MTCKISIHALLAESDPSVLHGFRPLQISIHALLAESDQTKQTCRAETSISIHALLAESDPASSMINTLSGDFYPRSPCGERLHLFASSGVDFAISIHALLAESDFGRAFWPGLSL